MASEFLSSITVVKNLVLYGLALSGTPDEARNAKNILHRVQRDTNTLRRLAISRWDSLDSEEQHEVEQAIFDVTEAMFKIAKPVKYSMRNEEKYGTVTLYRRIFWLLRDGDTVNANKDYLNTCHRSVSNQIAILSSKPSFAGMTHVNTNGSDLELPESSTSGLRSINARMLQDRAFWDNFANGRSRTSSSWSRSTLDDDDTRRREISPRPPSGGDSHHSLSDPVNDGLLLGIGTSAHVRGQSRHGYSEAYEDSIWDEFAARNAADAHRRGQTSSMMPDYLNDVLEEYRSRNEEDMQRRG